MTYRPEGAPLHADTQTADTIINTTREQFGNNLPGQLNALSETLAQYFDGEKRKVKGEIPSHLHEKGEEAVQEYINETLAKVLKEDEPFASILKRINELAKDIEEKSQEEASAEARKGRIAELQKTIESLTYYQALYEECGTYDDDLNAHLGSLRSELETLLRDDE